MSVVTDKPKSRSRQTPFPTDKFETIPRVVVFAEHQTRLRDGTPVTYDRQALEKIAANCNRRIEETGNYAAVCIGHTDRDSGDKPLIGFAGPFRVEERDGRAVILADFHIFKDEMETLRRYPRPSPEVWIPRDGFDPERIFLDPIAMLGAETPRLDLGMTFLYHARAGDLVCEKYAATLPAPGSVEVPMMDSHKKVKHAMAANLTPEDIPAILKAIESTDWYKWLRQQMAATDKAEDKTDKYSKDAPDDDDEKTQKEPPPEEDKARKEAYAEEPEDDQEPDDEPAKPELGASRQNRNQINQPLGN